MQDYLKFPSDKSFVHEVTYLTDAEYDLKDNPHKKRIQLLLKTIQNNHWYNAKGADISKIIKNVKVPNHNIEKYLHVLKDKLEND